jgi:outer membrane protein TolC
VGIKYNIASLYKSKSQIKASKIASQKAIENKALVQEKLANDIESAIIRKQEAQKVYETQLKGVQLATENYNIIRNRYLDDLVLMTEMLDAENAKIDAEMQAANAQINILFYHYQLKKLSGTL